MVDLDLGTESKSGLFFTDVSTLKSFTLISDFLTLEPAHENLFLTAVLMSCLMEWKLKLKPDGWVSYYLDLWFLNILPI